MSRFRKDRGWVNDWSKLPHGPNGRVCCRQCNVEVPKGRRTFCSDKCVHDWKITTNGEYARRCVLERDHGVCAICRTDTVRLKKVLWRVDSFHGYNRCHAAWKLMQRWYGWAFRKNHIRHDSLWQADHIVPVVEGGGACGLENLRTLCIRCHGAETNKLRKRRSKQASFELGEQHG